MHIPSLRHLNEHGFDHVMLLVAILVMFGVIGTAFHMVSQAATTTQWKGTLEAFNSSSGYCLTASGGKSGDAVELEPCSKTLNNNQVWSVNDIKVASVLGGSSVQEFNLASAAGSNVCLDDWGQSKTKVFPTKLYTCSSTDLGVTWVWGTKFTGSGYSSHQLANVSSGTTFAKALCIDDDYGSTASNNPVGLYNCKKTGKANQEWIEHAAPSGTTGGGGGATSGTVFSDSFPNSTLSSAWDVISRHGEYAQNETECNTPNEVSVANHIVTITTIAKTVSCGDFNLGGSVRHQPTNWPYETGDIQWKSFNFTYGTVSVRAKFPPQSTRTWPAIWMLGSNCQATNPETADVGYSTCPNIETNNYAEIDNVECFESTWCQTSMSQPGSWAACTYKTPVDNNWHVYKLVWTKTSVASYVDGVSTGCDYTSTHYTIPDQPMFLIIQTQTGGAGGTPSNSNLPTTFQVSNVTVTQP